MADASRLTTATSSARAEEGCLAAHVAASIAAIGS